MRSRRDRRPSRHGATMVESAITIGVFLTVVVGMIDLSIGVFRNHVLSQASRQLLRQAVVHGDKCPASWNGGPWGVSDYDGKASTSGPIPDAVRPYLAGLDPAQVDIRVTWPAGNNEVESPVRVTLSTPWRPILTSVFGVGPLTLRAGSTMNIAH